MTESKAHKTIQFLESHPDAGQIYVFEFEDRVVGYAIVINFWSNEYGGVILNVDEIFVGDAYRNHGIATDFFNYLSQENRDTAIGIELEALPSNIESMKFYEKNGFKKSEYALLYRPIE